MCYSPRLLQSNQEGGRVFEPVSRPINCSLTFIGSTTLRPERCPAVKSTAAAVLRIIFLSVCCGSAFLILWPTFVALPTTRRSRQPVPAASRSVWRVPPETNTPALESTTPRQTAAECVRCRAKAGGDEPGLKFVQPPHCSAARRLCVFREKEGAAEGSCQRLFGFLLSREYKA